MKKFGYPVAAARDSKHLCPDMMFAPVRWGTTRLSRQKIARDSAILRSALCLLMFMSLASAARAQNREGGAASGGRVLKKRVEAFDLRGFAGIRSCR